MRKSLFLLLVLLNSACTDYTASPVGKYAGYDCGQLWREKAELKDEIQQATDEQTQKNIFELAVTAFAISNGDSYTAKADTQKTDYLKVRLDEVKHEAIRKQCNL